MKTWRVAIGRNSPEVERFENCIAVKCLDSNEAIAVLRSVLRTMIRRRAKLIRYIRSKYVKRNRHRSGVKKTA